MIGSHRLCQLGSGRALLARTLGAFLPGMEIEALHMNSCPWGLLRPQRLPPCGLRSLSLLEEPEMVQNSWENISPWIYVPPSWPPPGWQGPSPRPGTAECEDRLHWFQVTSEPRPPAMDSFTVDWPHLLSWQLRNFFVPVCSERQREDQLRNVDK